MKNNIIPILEMVNVEKVDRSTYSIDTNLTDTSVSLYNNEIVVVEGDILSGNKTFFNVLLGLDTIDKGSIYFRGNLISNLNLADKSKFVKDNVSFVGIKEEFVYSYSLLENIIIRLTLSGQTRKDAKAIAVKSLKSVNLYNFRYIAVKNATQFQKNLLEVAIAVALNKDILAVSRVIDDENLKPSQVSSILETIKVVSKNRLVIILTKDSSKTRDIATRKLKFSSGKILEDREIINSKLPFSSLEESSSKEVLVPEKKNTKYIPIFQGRLKFLISVILVAFTMLLFTGLYSSFLTTKKGVPYNVDLIEYYKKVPERFKYNDKKRVIAYNSDNTILSSSDLNNSDGYFKNSMFANNVLGKSDFVSSSSNIDNTEMYYLHIPSPLKVLGRLPKSDSEVLLFRSTYGKESKEVTEFIGETKNITYLDLTYKVTVVGVVDLKSENTTYKDGFYCPYMYDTFLERSYKEGVISSTFDARKITDTSYYLGNNPFKYNFFDDSLSNAPKTDVIILYESNQVDASYGSKIFESLNYNYYGANLNLDALGYNYKFIDSKSLEAKSYSTYDATLNNFAFQIYINKSTIEHTMKDRIYSLETYTKSKAEVKDEFPSLTVVEESDYKTIEKSSVLEKINFKTGKFSIFINRLGGLNIFKIILYMSIVIIGLRIIFYSKNKDYQTLENLGLSKKKINKNIKLEAWLIGLFSTIFGYIYIFIRNYKNYSSVYLEESNIVLVLVVALVFMTILTSFTCNTSLSIYKARNKNKKDNELINTKETKEDTL